MLIVKIHNDGTGDKETANYDVGVFVTVTPTQLKRIAKGRIHHHVRAEGWRKLLELVAFQAEDEEP